MYRDDKYFSDAGVSITHGTLGFVLPLSAGGIGVDLVAGLMWPLFIYTAGNLYYTFRKIK